MFDDPEFWKKIADGDAGAFDLFYRENGPRLRSFLRRLLSSEQSVEDIMQDAFTQIWSHPQGFDPNRGSLRGYLFGIGRKLAAEWWRRQKPSGSLDADPVRPRTEMSSMVSEAFNRLSREKRTLLWLREVEGQSYAELANILKIPVGTVRSRLFAARTALRNIWHGERVKEGVPNDVR